MSRVVACLCIGVLLLVSAPAGAAAPPARGPVEAPVFLDLDGDGYIDLFVTGGKVAGHGVVIRDFDRDGRLDLYVNRAGQPVRPVIETIRIEGGKVEITGDTIKVQGGKVEIIRRLR
jgi:hypothetical protein